MPFCSAYDDDQEKVATNGMRGKMKRDTRETIATLNSLIYYYNLRILY